MSKERIYKQDGPYSTIVYQEPDVWPLPKVKIHESVLDPTLPYTVDFDIEKARDFYRTFDMNPTALSMLNITLKRNPPAYLNFKVAKILGMFVPVANRMTIYTDFAWNQYLSSLQADPNKDHRALKDTELPSGIPSQQGEDSKGKSKGMISVNISLGEATEIPFSKSQEEADNTGSIKPRKLLRDGGINGTFIHESKHALDFNDKRIEPYFITSEIIYRKSSAWLCAQMLENINARIDNIPLDITASFIASVLWFELYYALDPAEIRARNFTRDVLSDDKWKGIITLEPKKLDLMSQKYLKRWNEYESKHKAST